MNSWPKLHRQQQLSLLLVLATASGFVSSTQGQRLTPPPFAFPWPNPQATLPTQVRPGPSGRRMQTGPFVKRTVTKLVVTKAHLNQALIAEAYRRNIIHVAGLLAQGADPNASDKTGVPVLFYAVAVRDNLPVIILLLGKGANVNARDPRGNTALPEAVQLKADPTVLLLLKHKADPNVRNGAGFTPLGIATAESSAAIMHLLLAYGADPNAPQRGDVTPLIMAVSLGNPEAVHLLVEAGAVVNPGTAIHLGANGGRISPLSVTVASRGLRREAILLELLDHGADVNVRDAKGNPPLMVSVSRRDLAGVRLLLEHGAKVNAQDKLGRSALMVAAAQGNAAMVRLLLANGATINSRDAQGFSPLLLAVCYDHAEVARALLQNGASASLANGKGRWSAQAGRHFLPALRIEAYLPGERFAFAVIIDRHGRFCQVTRFRSEQLARQLGAAQVGDRMLAVHLPGEAIGTRSLLGCPQRGRGFRFSRAFWGPLRRRLERRGIKRKQCRLGVRCLSHRFPRVRPCVFQ